MHICLDHSSLGWHCAINDASLKTCVSQDSHVSVTSWTTGDDEWLLRLSFDLVLSVWINRHFITLRGQAKALKLWLTLHLQPLIAALMVLLEHLIDYFKAFLLIVDSVKPVAISGAHWSSCWGNGSSFAPVNLLESRNCLVRLIGLSEWRWLLDWTLVLSQCTIVLSNCFLYFLSECCQMCCLLLLIIVSALIALMQIQVVVVIVVACGTKFCRCTCAPTALG